MYDPVTRRFLTPDPVSANSLSSQAHNGYSYVQDNPATFTDPSGFFLTEDNGGDSSRAAGAGVGPGESAIAAAVFGIPGATSSPSPLDAGLVTQLPDMSNQLAVGNGADNAAVLICTGSQCRGYDRHGRKIPLTSQRKPGVVTVVENMEDLEQHGNTLFWRVGDEYYYLLPSEDEPRRANSKDDWENIKKRADQGVAFDAIKGPQGPVDKAMKAVFVAGLKAAEFANELPLLITFADAMVPAIAAEGSLGGGLAAAGATNLTRAGDGFGTNASPAQPVAGYHDVVVHGSPTTFAASPGGPPITPKQLAAMIRADPAYPGGPVRLISCNAGACNATVGQELANELGVEVLAPDHLIWASPSGRLRIGPSPQVNSGSWVPLQPQGGK